jgi:hypothetical protein
MGVRVPIYEKQILPDIARMQPIPLSAADTGAEKIGQAVSGLGADFGHIAQVDLAIQQKRVEMQDTRSLIYARDYMRNAEVQMNTAHLQEPDTAKWPEITQKITEDLKKQIEGLPISSMGWSQLEPELNSVVGFTDENETYQPGILERQTFLKAAQKEQEDTRESMIYDAIERYKTEGESGKESIKKEFYLNGSKYMNKEEIGLLWNDVEKKAEYERYDIIQNKAIALSQAGQFETADLLVAKSDLKPDMKLQLEHTLGILKSQKQAELKQEQEAKQNVFEQNLWQFFAKNDFVSVQKAIDSPSSPFADVKDRDRWQTMVNQKIDRIKKGQEDSSHPIAVSNFETMATDIWRGNITKGQFENRVMEAVKLPDSDPNAISLKEYQQVMKYADSELKQSQAQELSRIDEEAGRQLVDYRSEPDWLAAFSAIQEPSQKTAMSDKRKIQFENLAQYNREMREWLSSHPDAGGKEIYRQSRELLTLHRKKTDEEVMKKLIGGELPPEYPYTTVPIQYEPEQEEMVAVTSPDGRTGKIPKSRLEKALKQGYKQR